MDVRIVDTTIRVGEQMAGRSFKTTRKIQLARLLDSIGVYQIEAGIPAMGADAKKSIANLVAVGLKSKISSWNRLDLHDIQASMECNVDIIHISVPSSNMQISRQLDKTREWVLEYLRKCIAACNEKGYTATIGLEDASRADHDFLYKLISCAVGEGVRTIRYNDTAGLLLRKRLYDELRGIKDHFDVELEMNTHNDFGMAVANSVAAVKAGAGLVVCTAGGIGERSGNCNMFEFIKAAGVFLGAYENYELEQVEEIQKQIIHIVYR